MTNNANGNRGSFNLLSVVVAGLTSLFSIGASAWVTYHFEIKAENQKNKVATMQQMQTDLQDYALKVFTTLQTVNGDILTGQPLDAQKRQEALSTIAEIELRLNTKDPRWPDSMKEAVTKVLTDARTIREGVKNANDWKTLRPVLVGYQDFLNSKDHLVAEIQREKTLSSSPLSN
ncbi:hypothetical protein JHL17_34025 [Azospirillum sp. YIM B02556]|uniref:Methyl-accepting chemotaxis protein n=1 Tax=Azospirillum endophyticum TaxID=2800326 RepID=A0ABS1FG84_9PROT|nr:hypothetical protein [Azospirillum endophyticum]MBK1842425.1 hypothetical protein [Azospirillum endophyticum]